MSKFSKLIKQERLKRGLSLREAAKRMAIHYATLSQLERGEIESPRAGVLNDMRKVYSLSAKKLLDSLL